MRYEMNAARDPTIMAPSAMRWPPTHTTAALDAPTTTLVAGMRNAQSMPI